MPFDFTMYLIKADDCSLNDEPPDDRSYDERNLVRTSSWDDSPYSPPTFDLGYEPPLPKSSLVYRNDQLSEIESLTRDIEKLKMELNFSAEISDCELQEGPCSPGSPCSPSAAARANGASPKTSPNTSACPLSASPSSPSSPLASPGTPNGFLNSLKDSTCVIKRANTGPITKMFWDLGSSLADDPHKEELCTVTHCHMCKGPKRALSIDSVRYRESKVKRRVSFADDNGLPLTKVRVMPSECEASSSSLTSLDIYGCHGRYKQLRLDFQQPAADFPSFMDRLQQHSVSLENVRTDGTSFLGTVRVKNLAMEKDVRMRFTTDSWQTWTDIIASYVYEDATSSYDLFGFHVSVGHLPQEVEFAICYRVNEEEHWDNNNGKNYKLRMINY